MSKWEIDLDKFYLYKKNPIIPSDINVYQHIRKNDLINKIPEVENYEESDFDIEEILKRIKSEETS